MDRGPVMASPAGGATVIVEGMGPGRSRARGDTLQELRNSTSIKAAMQGKGFINGSGGGVSSGSLHRHRRSSFNQWLAQQSLATWLLALLGAVVLGTFIVLSTVKHYFGTHDVDFITLDEVQRFQAALVPGSDGQTAAPASSGFPEAALPFDASLSQQQLLEEALNGVRREKVPRIIHQTWKTDSLPERWHEVRQACMELLPDFEFKLWSDESARDFIAESYPSFLATWDSYPYNIQRADAIRYFVLHKFGGIYMDLDIGCRSHPGPLLNFETILPVTKPVGVSNDLMFSAPRTPFMDLVINSLETFNHRWLWMNYPTVMFSTGPMFVSAIYSTWCRIIARGAKSAALTPAQALESRVRILPKSLYGKNALPEDVPHSFFWHYYGSSWHAGDAGFIGFLGKYGYKILLLGSSFVIIGFCYLLWTKRHYFPLSPRPRKVLLEPFELVSHTHSPLFNKESSKIDDFLKTSARSVASIFNKNAKDACPPGPRYSPIPTEQIIYDISVRPPSDDDDTYSPTVASSTSSNFSPSHLQHYHPQQTQNQLQRDELDASRPHAAAYATSPPYRQVNSANQYSAAPARKQRSRDVEKGSPVRSRASSVLQKEQNSAAQDFVASSSAVKGLYARRTLSPESLPAERANGHVNGYGGERHPDRQAPSERLTLLNNGSGGHVNEIGEENSRQQNGFFTSVRPPSHANPATPSALPSRPYFSRHGSHHSSPPSTTPLYSASPREISTSPSTSEVSAPRRAPRRQPTLKRNDSDPDVSASELQDLLSELEPVNSRPIPSPMNTDDHTRMVRKRSFSNEIALGEAGRQK